jgi:hypothetical protein
VTTRIHYSETAEKFVVGYETGLIEIIDAKRNITYAGDIERLDISGQKMINHIAEYENRLYLSTPFGIVVYNLETLQFGDTYFIGNNSSAVFVNGVAVFNERIYAATREGVFSADVNDPSLIDFNRWKQPSGNFTGNFTAVESFNEKLYASRGNTLFEISDPDMITAVRTYPGTINTLKSSSGNLSLGFDRTAYTLDTDLNTVSVNGNTAAYSFSLHTALTENGSVYLATAEFGILKTPLGINDYTEIHPEGPSSNSVFSVTARNGHLWVVYGGYDVAFTPL